ncbi:MAG: putative DNA binding domain-containing protein [Bacteroidales bacterium]|nr:putative DNA binding domain-containing protein [Bacteroidales bacterium]
MNTENQNIELKESWRDEYLKWICGFANAQGGKLYIGIDDDGKAVGAKNAKKLMEDVPNKVRDTMGIVVDVELSETDGKEVVVISVPVHEYPVNYRGEYHYRSGSTKQLLQGTALTRFLLKKTGKTWDSVPIENVTEEDLDKESFDIFKREAIRSGRMSEDDLRLTRKQLLESLNLYDDGKLKRAAILLFHRNPEKWITGSWVKIGYFLNDADIRYQDEIHGSLMMQAERTIDLLYTKYLIAEISYDNITRIEHYPYPKDAVREAIFNALIHQDFAAGIPIQISVYSDKLYISNDCVFPDTWTAETLMQKHRSLPHNPDIANTFFRAGFIESWGRGIEKICTLCKNYGIPEPEYTVHPGDIMLKFRAVARIENHTENHTNHIAENIVESIVEKLPTMRGRIVKLVWKNPYASARTISEEVGIAPRNVQEHLRNLQAQGVIRRVGPDKGGHWEIIGKNSNNTE